MKRPILRYFLGSMCAASCWAGESSGGPFTLIGSVATGGGGSSSGGVYSLTGAAGQPDAGILAGGAFTVWGGFFGLITSVSVGDVTLTIELGEGGTAVLNWNVDGYTLEYREALNLEPDWQPVSPAPVSNSYVSPLTEPTRYFRLLKP